MERNNANTGRVVTLPADEYNRLIVRAERGTALEMAIRQGVPYRHIKKIAADNHFKADGRKRGGRR